MSPAGILSAGGLMASTAMLLGWSKTAGGIMLTTNIVGLLCSLLERRRDQA